MRIGFDGKRATHNFRGLGNYSRSLIEGLLEFKPEHELFLYTPPFKDQRSIDWTNKLKNLQIRKPHHFLEKKIPALWRSFFLEKEIFNDKIDLFHGLSHELPKLSTQRKFKTVVTIHDLIFIRYPEFFPWIDRAVYKRKFQYAVDNADLVIAICEQTKSDIINFLGMKEEKIKVHYQSASPLFYKINEKNEIENFLKTSNLKKPYILNVGAFEERKNQKSIVEVYSRILKDHDIDLVFVGTGKTYLNEVKELVNKKNLQHRIHFFQNFETKSLPLLYQGASLFFFPSHFEGFGIPIVEALFSNVPIVTSHGSCFIESAGPQSIFVDPTNLDSMTAGLSQVLNDKILQNEMKNSGLIYSKQFFLSETTKKLNDIYSLLN